MSRRAYELMDRIEQVCAGEENGEVLLALTLASQKLSAGYIASVIVAMSQAPAPQPAAAEKPKSKNQKKGTK